MAESLDGHATTDPELIFTGQLIGLWLSLVDWLACLLLVGASILIGQVWGPATGTA